jgi:hypothetical protein
MLEFIVFVVVIAGITIGGEYFVWRDVRRDDKKWKNSHASDVKEK